MNQPIISIMTNIKNEPDLIEWCLYHLHILKFDKIFICDNESDIPAKTIISKNSLIKDKITIFNLVGDKIKNRAREYYYNNFLTQSDWTLFIDADEYLVLKTQENIHDFLKQEKFLKNPAGIVDCITFNWKMMGSNGIEKRNSKLVIDNFTDCESFKLNPHVKSLVKNNNITDYSCPHNVTVRNITVDTNGILKKSGPFHEQLEQKDCIFHFWCKSKEDWINKCNTCSENNGTDDGGGMKGRSINRWNKKYDFSDNFLKLQYSEKLNKLMRLSKINHT